MQIAKLVILASLATAARADSIHIESWDGAGINPLTVADGLLTYLGGFSAVRFMGDLGTGHTAFCFDPCQAGITTGPLIGKIGDSWIFADGGNVHIGGITSVPFPPGTSPIPDVTTDPTACVDAGLLGLNLFGGPPCLADGTVTGRFIGNVTVTVLGLVEIAPDFFNGTVRITGPIAFDITPTLALGLGIVPGDYSGTYSASGFFDTDKPLADNLAGFNGEIPRAEQTFYGRSVPEPSALVLLLSTVLCLGWIARRWGLPQRAVPAAYTDPFIESSHRFRLFQSSSDSVIPAIPMQL
jgi:hypothetical protein